MKKLLYTLILLTASSCDVIDLVDGCDEPEQMELTENDRRWLLEDTVIYFAINQDTFALPFGSYHISSEPEAITDCKTPVAYSSSLAVKYIPNADMAIYTDLYRSSKNAGIRYSFTRFDTNTQVVGRSQVMGIIDLDGNRPMPMDDTYFVHSEYLGNHTIRGREFSEVYRFTDLDESNVPEIDVYSIIVSPMGFLRVEFYDGEVWERVIVE